MTDKKPGYAKITRESLEYFRSVDWWGKWLRGKHLAYEAEVKLYEQAMKDTKDQEDTVNQ